MQHGLISGWMKVFVCIWNVRFSVMSQTRCNTDISKRYVATMTWWRRSLLLLTLNSPRYASRYDLTAADISKLCPDMTGIDPDEAFSKVPYEKGSLFLLHLELKVGGQQKMLAWLNTYYKVWMIINNLIWYFLIWPCFRPIQARAQQQKISRNTLWIISHMFHLHLRVHCNPLTGILGILSISYLFSCNV